MLTAPVNVSSCNSFFLGRFAEERGVVESPGGAGDSGAGLESEGDGLHVGVEHNGDDGILIAGVMEWLVCGCCGREPELDATVKRKLMKISFYYFLNKFMQYCVIVIAKV